MFTVALEQRQYPTYILSDAIANSQVEVVPSRGGIVTSWQVAGQELFYLDTERFTHPDLSVRGGIPILFPICGNLPDNAYIHNGKTYNLKQHGFARDSAWQVVDQSTTDGASLSVVLESSEETLRSYPFKFLVTFTYKLQGQTLSILQKFENHSTEPMPFAAGLHPYFAAQDKSQLQVGIPGTEYFDKDRNAYAFNGDFNFNADEIDVAFEQLSGRSATVKDLHSKLQMTLSYDQHHPILVFWAVKGKDFYCLEPWTAPRHALVTGRNLITIAPNDSVTTLVEMSVSQI